MKDFSTLNELAREVGVNKSRLNHYAKEGLIQEAFLLERTKVFPTKDTLVKIRRIISLRDKGLSLIEIKGKV